MVYVLNVLFLIAAVAVGYIVGGWLGRKAAVLLDRKSR